MAVDGDQVTVGRRLGPVPGATTPDPDSGGGGVVATGERVRPDDPQEAVGMSVDEALQQPDGTVVVLDAAAVVHGDAPVRICKAPEAPEYWEWGGCPDDAPTPAGLTVLDNQGDLRQAWHGPLRVRVRDGVLHEVTVLGGGFLGGVLEP